MPTPARAAAFAAILAVCTALPRAQSDRASEILARAREAIGGEARLRAVHSLSVKATARTIGASVVITWNPDGTSSNTRTDDREARANITLEVLLPERFLLTRERENATGYYGLNGNRLLFDRGRTNPSVLADPQQMVRVAMLQHREFMRYVTAFLLTPPEQFVMQFADAGEAETDRGPADVIDATGAYQFAAKLYFHRETHRLLMLTAQEPPASPGRSGQSNPAEAGSHKEGAAGSDKERAAAGGGVQQKPEPLFKSLEGPPGTAVNLQIRFGDFRVVDGIALPHRIVSDTGRIDDWQVTKFKVNPEIDPRRFDK